MTIGTVKPHILIVEDDLEWQEIYRRSLRESAYEIEEARTAESAITWLKDQSFDLVITDLKMLAGTDDFSGFGVLEQAKAHNPDIQVIVITGYGSEDRALRAMRSGAYDYITKDRDLRKKLALTVQSALEVQLLKQDLLEGTREDDVELESDRIIGNSASMQDLFDQIARVAQSEVNVLLRGEDGTGKRLIAQTIHLQSSRKNGPFLVVDCGRLSEAVLESQLFGYEAGAFSGLTEARPGKFERSQGGTIFLDSIADLDFRLQTRLVGAICDRLVERVGGQESILVNARIIASTDKDLERMLSVRQFQRRLFDALNEFVISVPPLRERKDGDDIPALAAMFLQRHAAGRHVQFSPEAVELLRNYDYPGNVRELESAVKYALTTLSGTMIRPEHLRPEIRNYTPPRAAQVRIKAEEKDPNTILKVCPLNREECSKKAEIIRLYAPERVFVNVPDVPGYDLYEKTIRRTLERFGLVPVLPKDYLDSVVMFCNNCKLIQTCKYGITDISTSEANILHKLGQMHTIGMQCALLKEQQADQAVDHLQGLFFLEYKNEQTLANQLARWIEHQVKEAKPSQPTVFVSYSSKDEKELEVLMAHLGVLQHQNLIETWDDSRIGPGADWAKEIETAISQAKVAILLITRNFLTTEFILETEVRRLLERREQEGVTVVPIIARACAWRRVAWLKRMKVWPAHQEPIWRDDGRYVDEELAAIAEEIAKIMA